MPNPLELLGGVAIGTGIGQAVGDVVVPQLQDFKNDQWRKYPNRPLDPGQAALASIKGFPTALDLAREVRKAGYDGEVFGALEQNLRAHPDLPIALVMWRRGYITHADVDRYLQRHGFDTAAREALIGPAGGPYHLRNERLAPAQIALGIIRSIIDDPGLMPVNLDTAGGVVPAYPQSSIDPLQEAADNGIDRERLRVLVGEIGLPMSAQQAASALFRGLIERPDYNRAIVEGDTRPEWGQAILDQARQILTANQYAELELRGFLTADERRAETAKHGMSPRDSNLLFNVLGRSVNVHQIVTGEARGGRYKPPPATLAEQEAGIPPAFLASLQRGNLRPEYYDIAFANRYTYPSFFAIRGLLQGGVFATADVGYEILLEMGWKPSLARLVADFYWQPADNTTKVSARVKSAQTSAITEIRSAFLRQQADDATARGWLERVGVPSADINGMLPIWDVMKEVPQKGLTAAQIKKAYNDDPAKYPLTWAVAELLNLGYDNDDAAAILEL